MDHLSKYWWLYLPLAFMVLQLAIENSLPLETRHWMHGEQGPHELIQFIILVFAFLTSLMILLRLNWKKQMWLAVWVGIAALACFYVAGEEVSWGQKFLNWNTPEYWAAINDQNETNLHNTSSWLDQKPRLILLIGVIVGGLVIPALRRFAPHMVPKKFEIIYPPAYLGIISAITLGLVLADKYDEADKTVQLFERVSEVMELYLYYFVLLYLVALRRRILQH
jgi:hypothetical protein